MIASLAALGACAGPSATETLSGRLRTGLTADTACTSHARIEQASAGARIRIPEASLFAPGQADLTGCGQYTLASVTQALLEPRIMQVSIEPEPEPEIQVPGTTTLLARQRANAVAAWFANVAFLPMMRPIPVLWRPAIARPDAGSPGATMSGAPVPGAAAAGGAGPDAALSGRSLGLLVQAAGYR